ncbi:unnamed protein product [Prunus armeniaca]|uniref:Uncharacterized protein n=1 Tax=Prunus armeniaca TaxID=36596 RepID=A0A6J5W193_PRUAR|nr:unnamed protein product [Prunus armeniaca]
MEISDTLLTEQRVCWCEESLWFPECLKAEAGIIGELSSARCLSKKSRAIQFIPFLSKKRTLQMIIVGELSLGIGVQCPGLQQWIRSDFSRNVGVDPSQNCSRQ